MKKILWFALFVIVLAGCQKKTVYLKGPDVGVGVMSYTVADSMIISINTQSQNLLITNTGNVDITFSALASNTYLSLPVTSGTVTTGKALSLLVNVNRTGMLTGKYYSKIYLMLNDVKDSVDVCINNLKEEKMVLGTDVVDAEYSRARDILVWVSASPMKLNIYKASDGTTESVDLNFVPVCVSVSPDGATAVVGHDGHITYVDLVNKTIIRAYSISCFASDIVLGGNHWAYAFPNSSSWVKIHCVNLGLDYDNEMQSTGYDINGGTKAKLHPSGKYIYGADNNISPTDVEKYDIRNGCAAYMYDSPYHGDYPMDGDLWMSDEGSRIFTRGRTVLKTSELQSLDMLYNGTITLASQYYWIVALDQSTVHGSIFLVTSGDDVWVNINKPYVEVYHSDNLVYDRRIMLESFYVSNGSGGGTFYDPEPFFVFCNSAGNDIYVLMKATGAGLQNEWALQKIAV